MQLILTRPVKDTVCSGSSDQFYIVTYYIKWVTTSWTYSMRAIRLFCDSRKKRNIYCIHAYANKYYMTFKL